MNALRLTTYLACMTMLGALIATLPARAYDPNGGQHSWDSGTFTVAGSTAAYAAGNIVGSGYVTISAFARIAGGGVFVQGISAQSASTLPAAGLTLWLCDSVPTTTLTDHAALQMSAADRGTCHPIMISGTQQLLNYSTNTGYFAVNNNFSTVIRPTTGTVEYAFLTSGGAFTLTAANDVSFALNGLQD